MALNSLLCADVPLRTYTLIHYIPITSHYRKAAVPQNVPHQPRLFRLTRHISCVEYSRPIVVRPNHRLLADGMRGPHLTAEYSPDLVTIVQQVCLQYEIDMQIVC